MGTDILARVRPLAASPKTILRLARIAAFHREPYVGDRLDVPEVAGLADRLAIFDAGSVRISATDLRNDLAAGQGLGGRVPGPVAEYITKHGLYKPGMLAALKPGFSSQDKVREGLTAALDRKAAAVLVFNLTELTTMADYFVLSTASSDRQARAIADAIAEKLGPANSVEGMQTAHWILMDYGDVVFHVFQEEARQVLRPRAPLGRRAQRDGVFGELEAADGSSRL